jgi:serine/threonine-protein kinase
MLPEGQVFSNPGRRVVAISPDGTQLAYVANSRLYLRPLSALDARLIPGAEDQQGVLNPVFSPDGRSIAYWSANTIRRISINGGAAVTVCEASRPLGITWQADTILFGQGADGIKQVSENGGKPQTLVAVRPGEVAHGPQLLPGGQAVLFTITSEAGVDRWDKARIVVQPLGGGERKMIIEGGSDARYLPTGHLLYALQGVLLAVPFDLGRLEIRGSAIPAVEGVLRATIPDVNSGSAHFDVSNGGLLAYADAGSAAIASGRRNLGFVDRKGNVEITKIPPGVYDAPRLSPDAKRIAYRSVTGADEAIYIFDLSTSAEPRRLTFGGRNRFPVWSADGARVAFQSDRDGDLAIFWQRADGTDAAERLTKPEPGTSHVPESWSPQGDMLLYTVFKDAVFSIWALSLPDRKSERFGDVATATIPQTMFSPDGKWVAYRSQGNIYVQPFPATQAKYQVTAGYAPAWSRDGQQLFFAIGPQRVGVVRMHIGPGVTIANREEFAAPDVARGLTIRPFDVTPDGRIVASIATESAPSAQTSPRIHIVYNWFEELKARVPTK